MANNNGRHIGGLSFMGASKGANDALLEAANLCIDNCCEGLEPVEFFIALLDKTKLGKKILKDSGKTKDDFLFAFEGLAAAGEYGYMDYGNDGSKVDPQRLLTPTIMSFIAPLVLQSQMSGQGKGFTCDDAMNGFFETDEETGKIEEIDEGIEKLLDMVGYSYEKVAAMVNKEFTIPAELKPYVTYLNTSTKVTDGTFTNMGDIVKQMIEILGRKRKSNPCLVGYPGVGKTTGVYAYTQYVVDNKIDQHICALNMGTIVANTKYRGEFEERMQKIIKWASNSNIVLFMDEIHTLTSCNSGSNSASASDMIKGALADGEIKVIGATTPVEFHKSIEKDTALKRRFQRVEFKEPSVEEAITIVKAAVPEYAGFHHVGISNGIAEQVVKLSVKYIKSEYLPDKALTILDQAASHAKQDRSKYAVTEDDVLYVISKNTGVAVEKLNSDQSKRLNRLEGILKKNIIGQDTAVEVVSKAVRRGKVGIRENAKPIASFMFVGPTGVGKTEICKVLSNELGLGRNSFIKIDMSEYSTETSVTKLIGSDPGYVGYESGGILTEKVKQNPYSIVLLDEIEKAHPKVFSMLLQLLDEGKMTDNTGVEVDFTNCIVVMTSNAGYGASGCKPLGFGAASVEKDPAREAEDRAREALKLTFAPEFLNRIDNIVVFNSLTKENCKSISKLLLDKLAKRMSEDKNMVLTFDSSVVTAVNEAGYSEKYGARNIKRAIQDIVEDGITDAILDGTLYDGCIASIKYNKTSKKIKVTDNTPETVKESEAASGNKGVNSEDILVPIIQ